MSPVPALRLPLAADLSGFVHLLRRLRVPHRVSEEAGEQVLWVPSEEVAGQIRQLYERAPEGDNRPEGIEGLELPPLAIAPTRPGLIRQLRSHPMTALVLLACLIVAGVTLLGENIQAIGWLSFQSFDLSDDSIAFHPLAETLSSGQWWRLISPMLIHFGVLHLAMNGLWYWELGRRIETRQGAWYLLGLTLLFSLASNVTQYQFSGPSLFGGLSGVLYGLLGYLWIFQLLAPNPQYRLPRGVLVMMLVWLGLCLSGLVSQAGFGQIANGAHVGGLLAGCLTGLVGGVLARRSN